MTRDLANQAACEIVNLHLVDKPPCERYEAVLRIFVITLDLALAAQRDMMLTPSDN